MGDIVLKFRGQDYTLPEAKAFEAGEAVEEIAVLPEIMGWVRRPQFRKMARCFTAILRVAGCRGVTEKEVHADMMAGFSKGDASQHLTALMALIAVLMDGAPEDKDGEADAGKQAAAS